MPIQGFFEVEHNDPPAPFLRGMIYFPRLGIGGLIYFLIDTGSDRTFLPRDHAEELGIDYQQFVGRRLLGLHGVSGPSGYYREEALVLFSDDSGRDLMCRLVVGLSATGEGGSGWNAPPLLGRDFLNLCDLRVNPNQGLVQLEPFNVEAGFIR